jgi:hypothetical protein
LANINVNQNTNSGQKTRTRSTNTKRCITRCPEQQNIPWGTKDIFLHGEPETSASEKVSENNMPGGVMMMKMALLTIHIFDHHEEAI